VQEGAQDQVVEGAWRARVQTVSWDISSAAGVCVCAEGEGGEVENEAVLARRCRVPEARARGSIEVRQARPVVTGASTRPVWRLIQRRFPAPGARLGD
jgi:hypothetical protein